MRKEISKAARNKLFTKPQPASMTVMRGYKLCWLLKRISIKGPLEAFLVPSPAEIDTTRNTET